MAAKRKIVIKKKEKVEEVKPEVIEEETPVSTVVEKVITAPKHVKMKDRVLGDVGGSKIVKPVGKIRFEAQV